MSVLSLDDRKKKPNFVLFCWYFNFSVHFANCEILPAIEGRRGSSGSGDTLYPLINKPLNVQIFDHTYNRRAFTHSSETDITSTLCLARDVRKSVEPNRTEPLTYRRHKIFTYFVIWTRQIFFLYYSKYY